MATRFLSVALLFCSLCEAANIRLYLKDGEWHLVREYSVQGDRVRFFSTERGDWEEMPLSLVDLKRTEAERKERAEAEKTEAAFLDAEEKAEREAAAEVARVPVDAGVYWVNGKELKPLTLAEATLVHNKRRSILKKLSPLPMVAGKGTLELEGAMSQMVVDSDTPEFYFRLAEEQRFGLVKLTPGKNSRIVEKVTMLPVTNEVVEEQEQIDIFRRQVGEQLYKIWPQEALDPGEYAVVEYTEGKLNIQVYDFAYRPGKGGATPAAPPKGKPKSDKR